MVRMGSSVSQLAWTMFGGALGEIYDHVEGHRIDSATVIVLAFTTLMFDEHVH